jgi:hypothetical protein
VLLAALFLMKKPGRERGLRTSCTQKLKQMKVFDAAVVANFNVGSAFKSCNSWDSANTLIAFGLNKNDDPVSNKNNDPVSEHDDNHNEGSSWTLFVVPTSDRERI